MKRIVIAVMIAIVTPVFAGGCAAWIPSIMNVLDEVQGLLAWVPVIEQALTAAFNALLPSLPSADQVEAQATFNKALATLDASRSALAAIAASGKDADKGQLVSAIQDIVNALQAAQDIVNTWQLKAHAQRVDLTGSAVAQVAYFKLAAAHAIQSTK